MSTNQTSRDTWRKFLGIKDPSAGLENGRAGGSIGRTAGRSGGGGGGGELDSDSVPEGEESSGAEKGDGAGDAGKQIKQGDEFDRLEDLYDCETGEEVTLDGLGEENTERYPTGFENCEGKKKPTLEELIANNVTIYSNRIKHYVPSGGTGVSDAVFYYASSSAAAAGLLALRGNVNAFAKSHSKHGCDIQIIENGQGGTSVYMAVSMSKGDDGIGSCEATTGYAAELFNTTSSDSIEWKQAYLDNWAGGEWPAPDRNHLTWSKEKGCFEPLCPELNNQVLDKFKACEEERILCDKDGNKVKVTIDGDTVKVTQAKYNQTAEIKDGKVQTVKKLTESQKEAEFK